MIDIKNLDEYEKYKIQMLSIFYKGLHYKLTIEEGERYKMLNDSLKAYRMKEHNEDVYD